MCPVPIDITLSRTDVSLRWLRAAGARNGQEQRVWGLPAAQPKGEPHNENVNQRHWQRVMRRLQGPRLLRGAAIHSTGSASVSTTRVKCRVLVDFDGTIAPIDTTDLLLERFAAPAWHDIEDDWKAGRIGSRECLVRQIDLVRATPAEPWTHSSVPWRSTAALPASSTCSAGSATRSSSSPTGSTAPSGRCWIATRSTFRISPITCSGAATTAGG